MATGIFAGCVFYLDVDARLGGPASLSGEQKSQDFADTSASDFAASLTTRGAHVLQGACARLNRSERAGPSVTPAGAGDRCAACCGRRCPSRTLRPRVPACLMRGVPSADFDAGECTHYVTDRADKDSPVAGLMGKLAPGSPWQLHVVNPDWVNACIRCAILGLHSRRLGRSW